MDLSLKHIFLCPERRNQHRFFCYSTTVGDFGDMLTVCSSEVVTAAKPVDLELCGVTSVVSGVNW